MIFDEEIRGILLELAIVTTRQGNTLLEIAERVKAQDETIKKLEETIIRDKKDQWTMINELTRKIE